MFLLSTQKTAVILAFEDSEGFDTMVEAHYHAKLIIAPSSVAIGPLLSEYIIASCTNALASSRDVFTIALSGGSVPTFLSELPKYVLNVVLIHSGLNGMYYWPMNDVW